ncbi:MAG TPA: hypothetical protein VFC63_28305, partial [Blastocatellia bacterium]|nr:hypothetical protein [Blastocatellia bacterium]
MSKSRTVSTRLLPILLLLFAFGPRALAQDDSPKDRTARDDSSSSPARIVVPVPASPDFQNPPSTTSEARSFLIDILKDQKAIYTSPAHIKKHDLKFLIPIAATTAVLLATDHQSGDEITERPAKDLTGFSYHLGQATDVPTAVALIGGTYLASRVFHKDRLRETARLMAEAEIDSAILVNIIKVSARRERPSSGAGEGAVQLDEARGRFEVGGSSFPSGHSIEWFTMASVVAEEYRDKPLIAYSAYGVA